MRSVNLVDVTYPTFFLSGKGGDLSRNAKGVMAEAARSSKKTLIARRDRVPV